MSIQTKLDRLASDLANVKHQLHAVANSPQAQRTSVEGGALEFNDEDGNLKAIMGAQDDGGYTTVVVSGPVPPVPTNYGVDVDFGKAVVHWSGDFENALVAPSDWARTEVYAQPGEFVTPSREYARGSMVAASGGSVTIGLTKGQWTFCLVAWSQAGRMSAMSTPVTVDIPGYGDIVLAEIDAAETAIKNAGEMLVDGQQTLADKLANMGEGMDPEQIAQDIATARQEAIDAALEEINAVEGSLTSLIGDKNTTTWSTSNPPTEYAGVVGDTWIKLTSLGSGGREIERRRWSGTTWVVHKVDGAVLSNVDASTITAGFLDVANRIRSGSIFADKLLIGGGGNLIPWDQILRGDTTDPIVMYQSNNGSLALSPPDSTLGVGRHIAWTRGATDDGTYGPIALSAPGDKRIPVEPNTTYTISARLYSTDLTSGVLIRAYQYSTESYSYVNGANGPTVTLGPTPQNYSFQVTTNAKTNYLMPMVLTSGDLSTRRGTVHIADWSVKAAVDGTLITPGGVQTPHLAADVLEVGNLKAGTAAIAEAVVKKLFAEVVVAQMVQATEFIGENAILTGAVTAPKITASEELWAKLGQFVKIRTEHLEADAIDGMVVTGATFRSPDDGFHAGDDGVFIAGPDGTSIVRFPTDGSPLSLSAADVDIERANVEDLEMLNGSVRSGGRVMLESGVVAPVSPPVVTSEWALQCDISDNDWQGNENVTRAGLDQWNGKWVRALNIHGNTSDDKIQIINPDGTLDREFKIDFNPRYGITVMGDIVYVFGVAWSGGQAMIRGYNLNTGSRTKSWNYDRKIENQQALGNDGTYLLVAGVYADGLWVHKRSVSKGNQVGSDMRSEVGEWPTYGNKDLFGVHIDGSELTVVPSGGRIYTISGSTLKRKKESANRDGYAGWGTPGATVAAWWDSDGTPYVATVDGKIFKASGRDTEYSIETRMTWYDGTHETNAGPSANVTVKAQAFPVLSLPARPGIRKRVYYRAGSSPIWNREELAPETKSFRIELGGWSSYTYPPPTENTFPVTDPAEIRTSNLNFQVVGTGAGRWGSMRVSASGEITGLPGPIVATGGGVDFPKVTPTNARTVVITFPSGRFTKAPAVSAMTSHGRLTPVVFNITKDSFSFRVWNFTDYDASGGVGTWMAVQEA